MGLKRGAERISTERMSDGSFRGMTFLFKIVDFFHPHIDKRVKKFGIKEGMTVVDYGCGPGRYTVKFAEMVGENGRVYAVDIHELAIEAVNKRIRKDNLKNIEPVLIQGYDSTLPDNVADVVCAIDMFFIIKKPTEFLAELKRITKSDGTLVIDDGHQPRDVTKSKIFDSGLWDIVEETRDHLKCRIR
ncbi:MAG: class I SAM-dependent methyltransferase [Chloroflexota bacterium]|nr:MAG: class I SAM-dependent methyltransferase [Chloroflexota bacterium]